MSAGLMLLLDLACAAATVSQPLLLTRRVLGSLLLHPVAAAAAPPASQAPSRLYEAVAARRPSDWTAAERPAIDALVEEVAALRAPWRQSDLRGVWRLAYLLPGPDGAGVDRRVPFPELPFNDNFQDPRPHHEPAPRDAPLHSSHHDTALHADSRGRTRSVQRSRGRHQAKTKRPGVPHIVTPPPPLSRCSARQASRTSASCSGPRSRCASAARCRNRRAGSPP